MVDSYTTSLRIVQMPTGSNDKLWGVKADAAFAMLEQAIAGSVAIDLTSANHTLTTVNNASDEARNMVLNFTGTPGTTRTVTAPNVSKLSLVINTCDSDVILTTGAGFSALIKTGQVAFVFTDGSTNAYAFLLEDLPGHGTLSMVYAHESL